MALELHLHSKELEIFSRVGQSNEVILRSWYVVTASFPEILQVLLYFNMFIYQGENGESMKQ